MKKPGGVHRREFVKSAVAIGGMTALSACLNRERESTITAEEPAHPQGPEDLSSLPDRQHAWNDYLVRDPHGNSVQPRHQLVLLLDYAGEGTPTDSEREQVEAALRTVDRAYQRGTGGDDDAVFHEGVLSMLSYSPAYFERFDDPLPDGVDLPSPDAVVEELGEDATPEPYDAAFVAMSDYGSVLLAIENALFGELDSLNGVPVEGTFEGVLEKRERRTGFIGKGLPAEKFEEEGIPEHAPLSMGYKSGFTDALPSEDKVTIEEGAFAESSTLSLSRLRIDLENWYAKDDETRLQNMFSPDHAVEDVGETAEHLASDSGVTEEMAANTERDAKEHGCVGHTQKTARARDDDFEALILRRSEGNATDVAEEGVAGMNFTSIQRRISDFVETRKAMNAPELDDDVEEGRHGILDSLSVERRGVFLVPDRRNRALPRARPER